MPQAALRDVKGKRIVISFAKIRRRSKTTRSDVETIQESTRVADRGSSGVQRGLIRNTNFTRISDDLLILIQSKSFYCHNCRDKTLADRRVGGSPAQKRGCACPPRFVRCDKTIVLVATRCIDFVVQYGNCEVEPLQLQYDCRTAIFVSPRQTRRDCGKRIFCGLHRNGNSSHHCVSTD